MAPRKAKASSWLSVFRDFASDVRIVSKEIASTDERGIKLEMWESQKRFMANVGEGLDQGIRRFNALKSRQLGVTTISLLIDTFWLAFHHNMVGALVSDTEKNRDVNRSIIEHYIRSFPEDYFGEEFKVVKSNRTQLQFSNGSRLDLLVAGTKKKHSAWGEGVGYTLIHCTEVGSYGDPEGFASFQESWAQANPDRLVILESTAKGFNMWREMWMAGQDDILGQRSFFIGWWAGDTNRIERSDPRFSQFGTYPASGEERERVKMVAELYGHKITPEQLAWIRWRATTTDQDDMFAQNQPWTAHEAFVTTGYSFFQTRRIGKDIERIVDGGAEYGYKGYRYEFRDTFFDLEMVEVLSQDEQERVELRIWEEPVKDGKYVVGFDPAYGRNEHKDRHSIEVYRCFADKLVQVAEYATSQVEVKFAAWVCAALAGAYGDCMVIVELGGPGRMVMQEWDHLRNILNAELNERVVQAKNWENALQNARWYLFSRPDTMGRGFAANFETTTRTKLEIMHQMRGEYTAGALMISSIPLLDEMRIVVQDGDQIGAPESRAENSKDDRVFATALANRAWLNWRRGEMLAEGLTYEIAMKQDRGELPQKTQRMNNIVYRYLKTRAELAEMPKEDKPQWLRDRGL